MINPSKAKKESLTCSLTNPCLVKIPAQTTIRFPRNQFLIGMIGLNLAIFQTVYKTKNEVKESVNVRCHAINSLAASQDQTHRERGGKMVILKFLHFLKLADRFQTMESSLSNPKQIWRPCFPSDSKEYMIYKH